jgi:uncharacterized protein YjiS (DUF1127 family)
MQQNPIFVSTAQGTAQNTNTTRHIMAYASDIQSANAGITDRFAALIKNLGARYARYKTYRRTLNELASLSNAELRDLGLCRAQIRSVAYEHVYDAH